MFILESTFFLSRVDFFPEREGAVQLGVLPFYHMFAVFVNLVLGVAWGQTTVTMRRFEAQRFLHMMQDYQVRRCISEFLCL